MDIRNIRPTRLAWAIPAVVAAGTLIGTAMAPPAHAGTSNGPGMPSVPSTWTCRQYNRAPYMYHGVQSDACDGYFPGDNHFMGEVDALVWNRRGVLVACRVQLNVVRHHHAYPMRGYTATAPAYAKNHYCDAQASWKLPPGDYNVTTEYLSTGGVWYSTVQGPVVHYPGA